MNRRKVHNILGVFLFLYLITSNLVAATIKDYPSGAEEEYLAGAVRKNELLVKFKEEVGQERIAEINKEFNVTVLDSIEDRRVCHIRIPKGTFIAEIIKKYRHLPEVQYALLNSALYKILLTEKMGGKKKNNFRVQQERSTRKPVAVNKLPLSSDSRKAKDKTIIDHTGDANFVKDVLKSELPVLVDFYYPGCLPCKEMVPLLKNLSIEYKGKLKIYKVRVDKSKGLSLQYKVKYVPTLIIFKDGQVKKKITGKISYKNLVQTIDEHLME